MRMIMTTERQLYLRRDGWLTGIVIAMAVLVTPGCGSQQPAGMATDLRPNAAATPTPRSVPEQSLKGFS
ncbi:MAG: hypothetical protein EBS83_02130 [Planctomycetia bacterium]|nr:hypothetical protein [Planctomycetia bacterium]